MLSVNQKIPDMEFDYFQDGEIRKGRFSDYKGKWLVLMFYPADFTFVCPTELNEAAKMHKEFKSADADIISVSTDTAYVHKAWHGSNPMVKEVRFAMAADPGGKLSKAFGTYIEDEGLSTRATFIIDPDGTVKSMEMHDNSIGRSAAEILRKLHAVSFVRENKGQVCPAGWKPGAQAIKVGK